MSHYILLSLIVSFLYVFLRYYVSIQPYRGLGRKTAKDKKAERSSFFYYRSIFQTY